MVHRLAVVGVLNAAVAAAYYLRIVAVMYFRTPLATLRPSDGRGAWWAAVACAIFVLGIGLYSRPLVRETNDAAENQFVSFRQTVDQVSSLGDALSSRPIVDMANSLAP